MMRDCGCIGICLLCACQMRRDQKDAIYWSSFAGSEPGEIHLAVSEAIRVDKAIPAEALAAVKAKQEVLGKPWSPKEYVEALDSIRRQRRYV